MDFSLCPPAFLTASAVGTFRHSLSHRVCPRHRLRVSKIPLHFSYSSTSPSVPSRSRSCPPTTCSSSTPTPSPDDSASSSSSSASSSVTQLKVGQIVAIQRAGAPVPSGGPELGMVTGCSSSGETVDVQPLEAFVAELYVVSKKRGVTFEKAGDVRAVNYEYAPTQDGWIVLDDDLVEAVNFFRARIIAPPSSLDSKTPTPTVQVSDDRPGLSDDAKKRQRFRPSRQQAFTAALLSVPTAAAFWAAFTTARQTFAENPIDPAFLQGNAFRTFITFVTAGSSVLSLIVGSALFLYALGKADDDDTKQGK